MHIASITVFLGSTKLVSNELVAELTEEGRWRKTKRGDLPCIGENIRYMKWHGLPISLGIGLRLWPITCNRCEAT